MTERGESHFRWTANIAHPQLSFHQRLISEIVVEVDGKELETRRKDGELVSFFQITDGEGTRYQGHSAIQLGKLAENVKAATVQSEQRAFFLPGDYQLAVVLLDTATREHTATQMKFRVSAPSPGILAEAWRNLPSVEFITDKESPDRWYLPDIQGRLQWAATAAAPVHMNVILNVAPSVPVYGARHTPSEGLPALLPTLKVISEAGSAAVSEHIELLDLARRRAVFQNDVQAPEHELDWASLKASLAESNTASIDLHSLSDRHHDAQFFVSEVRRVLRVPDKDSDKPGVLVILSTPVAFESGEDLDPISLESLPACRVFYIRYHAAPQRAANPYPQMGGRGRGMRPGAGPMGRRPGEINVVDQLEATLKPLKPKLFDVETPEEITKALSEIQKRLGK